MFAASEGVDESETPALPTKADLGGQAPSNAHVRRLGDGASAHRGLALIATVLRTYNQYERELGYVQGMSDLASPLYVTLKADEAMVFWCFVRRACLICAAVLACART